MLSPEQIEQRLSYVTGSDVGTILGLNRFESPVELWQVKTRRFVKHDISDKPAVKAGNRLEQAVADWFAIETGKEIYQDDNFIVHPTIPLLGGNIDRRITGENALLECKTTQSEEGWGEGYLLGDNRIPDSYLCQVIHYCAITGCDVAYIAVLIRGIDFRWFKYEHDLELEKYINDKCIAWWNNHVVADVAPEPTNEDEVIALLRGKVSAETITTTDEIAHTLEALKQVRNEIDMLEEREKYCRDLICVYMGDKQTLLNIDGTVAVTWKQRPGTITFDSKKFKDEHPEMYSQFEKQGKEVRSFLVKKMKDK